MLKQRGTDIVLTNELVSLIAGNFEKEVMRSLLDQRGADVVITEEVMKAVAKNGQNGKEVMALLLK